MLGCGIGSAAELGGPFAACACDPVFRVAGIGFFGVVRVLWRWCACCGSGARVVEVVLVRKLQNCLAMPPQPATCLCILKVPAAAVTATCDRQ